jgi:hypothetical protein
VPQSWPTVETQPVGQACAAVAPTDIVVTTTVNTTSIPLVNAASLLRNIIYVIPLR